MISLIAAMDRNGAIGKGNRIPWRLPADLAYFKKATLGHTVVMGRKTYESIGRPLPGRENIIITRNTGYKASGCRIFYSFDELLRFLEEKKEEVFVIGGAEIYRQFFPWADKLYITFINAEFNGDKYFPEIDPKKWALRSEAKGKTDEDNPYEYYFRVYEKVK